MQSLGVDLAAEPQNTAIAMIEWQQSGALVTAVSISADDDAVVHQAEQADKVGIDCPLGWPDAFVDFLIHHRDGRVMEQQHLDGARWRRSLAYRRTDEYVRSAVKIIPLSVATDRIGLTAMRVARLQQLLAHRGHAVDRAGTGLIVEVYPAAGLKHWGLPHRSYKGSQHRSVLNELVDRFTAAAPWLDLGEHQNLCRQNDHVFDAIIAAVLGHAALTGNTVMPSPADQAAASREGWIALPTCTLAELLPRTIKSGAESTP